MPFFGYCTSTSGPTRRMALSARIVMRRSSAAAFPARDVPRTARAVIRKFSIRRLKIKVQSAPLHNMCEPGFATAPLLRYEKGFLA